MTRLEQETIINFNEAETTATIYTHNAALCRKLEALADQRPEEVKRGRSFPDGGQCGNLLLVAFNVCAVQFHKLVYLLAGNVWYNVFQFVLFHCIASFQKIPCV